MDSPLSKSDTPTEKFVVSRPSTVDSKAMKGCGLDNLTWVGVDKEELRQRLIMLEYLRLAMRDCIKRKDSTAIPEHLLLPGGAVADMAPQAPMVVFINPKSGGHHGPVLIERLQPLMSEEQVFDLTEGKPHGWQQIENKEKDTNCVVQEGAQFATRLVGIKENAKFQKNDQKDTHVPGLKSVVENAKQRHNVKQVFAWHALSGYWGGVKPTTSL